MIREGDELPDVVLAKLTPEGELEEVGLADYADGKTIVLVGLPGPFTPTCSKNHLPGYLAKRDELLALGVDRIAVLAVTDAYAMDAWAITAGGRSADIDFLADGNAEFVFEAGLDDDRTADRMGMRSKRFSMLVEDGQVTVLRVEKDQKNTEETGVEAMIEAAAKRLAA